MGLIILAADAVWTYQGTWDQFWLALGIIIGVADVIWLLLDWSLMKG